jgi:hypothetical protein
MEKLKKDKRGYPIPVNVLVDNAGRPHFTVNDENKRQALVKKDQCAICGRGLLKRRALVGGPGSTFHPHGAFIDTAMHIECARYALEVCPYLAAPSYSKRIDEKTIDPKNLASPVILADNTTDPNRPLLFCLVIHTKQRLVKDGSFVRYVKPVKPYFAVEYWQHGKQLLEVEGIALVKEALAEAFEPDLLQAMEKAYD